MSSKEKLPPPSKRPNKPNDEKDWGSIIRGVILFALVIGMFLTASRMKGFVDGGTKNLDYAPDFINAVEKGEIKNATITGDGTGNQYVYGEYTTPSKGKYKSQVGSDAVGASSEKVTKLLDQYKVPYKFEPPSTWLGTIAMTWLPFLIPLLILWFLFARQMRSMGRGALSFGKSRARLLNRDKNKITFKDVAGVEEAKDEVQEIVEFLKDPKKFQMLGGRIPKGVLMIGPPGTGKTLLAKAIAGEADVPFFSISGSDFVEMFVGVGASRVRDMFEQGRKNAPCLIFIDEIDAVGRSRFSGIGGGHDEREQTLNALLVEMDGFDTQEGIILIAATNRPDVLDTALLRPGRFDRQVVIDLPDVGGREMILKVHSQKVKMAADVDLSVLARGTPGFSGADLANLINEAALLAARNNKKGIEMVELEEARDKVRFGRERRSRVMDEKDKEITAYHEAGHAIVMVSLENTEPVHKVTIIPRGNAYLGATMQLPEKDRYTYGRKKVLDELATYMGGRIAEELIFKDITSGAYGDIKGATRLARKMVCEWGMSEKLGFIEYVTKEDTHYMPHESAEHHNFSEATAVEIDKEVRRIVDEAYARAKTILTEKKDKLEALAKALLEYETLDGNHVKEIMEHGHLMHPPSKPKPPVYLDQNPKVAPGDLSPRSAQDPLPPGGALPSPAV
jgi:cell division protease FtsH